MKIDFESFLQDKHGEQCTLPGDMWPDDFERWIQGLEIEDFIKYANEFAQKIIGEKK